MHRTSNNRPSLRRPRPGGLIAATTLLLAAGACAPGGGPSDDPAAVARRLDVASPGVDDRSLRVEARERWRWPTPDGGNVGLPSTDARGVVVVHSGARAVALGAEGELEWSIDHVGLRPVEPLLAGDTVVLAGEDEVLAVDRRTGARRWAAPVGHERANAPALAGADTVVVTTWEGRLLALDVATGEVRWSATLPGPSLWPPAATASAVVATWDGGWGAWAVSDGAPLWEADLWPDGATAPAVVPGARPIAVVSAGGRVDGRALRDGRLVWQATSWADGSVDQAITVCDVGGRPGVAVPDIDGGITVVDARRGHLLWTTPGDPREVAARGRPAAVHETLAYTLDGGLRLAWPGGHHDVDLGGPAAGVAPLEGGAVVTTWHADAPAVVALDIAVRR